MEPRTSFGLFFETLQERIVDSCWLRGAYLTVWYSKAPTNKMHMHIDNKHKHMYYCKALQSNTAPTPISGDSFASTSMIGCFGRGTAQCICRGWKLSLLCLRHANWWLLAREWWERTTATGGERKCHCRAFGMRPGATWLVWRVWLWRKEMITAQRNCRLQCIARSWQALQINWFQLHISHVMHQVTLATRQSIDLQIVSDQRYFATFIFIYIYILILWYRSVASNHYVFPAPFTLMRTARFQTGLCFPWESGGRDWEWTGRPHLGW